MLDDDSWATQTALVLGVDPESAWEGLAAEYLGVRLSFCANNALATAWARFFLGTHFDVTDAPAAAYTCVFHYGTFHMGALHDLVQTAAPVRVQLDRRRLATRWSLGPGRSIAVSDDSEFWYVIDRDAGRFVFLSPSEQPVTLRETARQIRSIVCQLLRADGWLPFHASAVVADGVGLLFPGDKGAGKSSTMLELVRSSSAVAFVSNDHTFGRCEDGELRIAGSPHTIRLGAGSLAGNRLLQPHLHAWEHFHATLLPLGEQVSHPDKLDLTVGEFTSIVGCDYRVTTPVRVIAFPELLWEPGRSTLRRLAPEDTASRLADATRFPDPEGDTWVGTLLFPMTREAVGLQCAEIASTVDGVSTSGTATEMATQVVRYAGVMP